MKQLFYLSFLFVLMSSCSKKVVHEFEVSDFDPMSNYDYADTLEYQVDLRNALREGIIIPTKDGNAYFFVSQFKIRNTSSEPQHYYYKIFYQNESYSFSHNNSKTKSFNDRSKENFYGSWASDRSGFHKTDIIQADSQFYNIIDTILIHGNPRNEKKYYGGEVQKPTLDSVHVQEVCQVIRKDEKWMESILKKAKDNGISIEEQIELDAIWIINDEKKRGDINCRWKRNPRTGIYSFLLVVVEENELEKIPQHYQDVCSIDSASMSFKNPYSYFLNKEEAFQYGRVQLSAKKLKVKVKYDLSKGIFLDVDQNKSTEGVDYNGFVNNSDSNFFHAPFEQYLHSMSLKHYYNNIPEVKDIFSEPYNRSDYKLLASKYKTSDLVKDHIRNTETAGKALGYQPEERAIEIKNLGYQSLGKYRKENVGIIGRYGHTYGKFRAKIKFPKIVNVDSVWNGLTCAFWLIYQDGEWNRRCNCNTGFNPKLFSDSARVKSSSYTEIDIEIVKTSKYWEKDSVSRDGKKRDNTYNKNLTITSTNWDLACQDPKDFFSGRTTISYQDQEFEIHRWSKDYRAITSKFEYPHDSLMGVPVYYEIEWHPNYIVWRIGKRKDQMKVFAYLDDKCTMIPDNQMRMVFTQEYHLSKWWPFTPFRQELMPYPLNDLTGYIYEVEVE